MELKLCGFVTLLVSIISVKFQLKGSNFRKVMSILFCQLFIKGLKVVTPPVERKLRKSYPFY